MAWWSALPPKTPYDVVIKINSLTGLSFGWEIAVKQTSPEPEKSGFFKFFSSGKSSAPSSGDVAHSPSSSSSAPRRSPSSRPPQIPSYGLLQGSDASRSTELPESARILMQSGKVEMGVVVGVLGDYNRGKSWLFNQVCQINLDSGLMTHTEGLSMACPKNSRGESFVVLDIAGGNVPCTNEVMKDSIATEAFLRELAIDLSDILLITVNRLQRSDQLYINSVLSHLKRYKLHTSKKVFIVHNLDNVTTEAQVDEVIELELKSLFGATRQTYSMENGRKAFYYISKQDGIDITHLIFAQARSAAGKCWNANSGDILHHHAETANRSSLNLFERVFSFSNARMPHILDGVTKEDLDLCIHDTQPWCVIRSRHAVADVLSDEAAVEFRLNPGLCFDEAGSFTSISPLQPTGAWEPQYCVQETQEAFTIHVPPFGLTVEEEARVVVDYEGETVTIKGSRAPFVDAPRFNTVPLGEFCIAVTLSSRFTVPHLQWNGRGWLVVTCPKQTKQKVTQTPRN